MKKMGYRGIYPAFYACYDAAGEVSVERTRALVKCLMEKGIDGLYVCGSSGECIYLDVEERKRTLEAVLAETSGKIPVIAHVACNNLRDSRELAAHAESVGADAIAAIPPIYFHLPEYAIAEYWNGISAAAPHTDMFVYNIPQLAGVGLTRPLLREMRKNPRVVGVKNSSMPTQDIQMWKADGGENFTVFNGPDEQFIAGRAIGADGGIGGTYAVMPELYRRMDALVEAGQLAMARKIQNAANEVTYAMCAGHGNMYAFTKEIIRVRDGIDIGSVRAPLPALIPEDEARVQACIKLIDEAVKAYT